jgi:hypothetical protein
MANAYSRFGSRLARLEKRLPPPPPMPNLRRMHREFGRPTRQVRAAAPLLTEEEDERDCKAVDEWLEGQAGTYAQSLRELENGRCTVPKVAPEAMKALLLAWLSPQCDTLARVCRQCGLEYPDHKSPPMAEWKLLPGKVPLVGEPPWYDLPDFFAACPSFGESVYEVDPPHRIPYLNPP